MKVWNTVLKKLTSMILVVAMVVCVIPAARVDAAPTATDYASAVKELAGIIKKAQTAGYKFASSTYTASLSSDKKTYTITDKTDNSYVYEVALYFQNAFNQYYKANTGEDKTYPEYIYNQIVSSLASNSVNDPNVNALLEKLAFTDAFTNTYDKKDSNHSKSQKLSSSGTGTYKVVISRGAEAGLMDYTLTAIPSSVQTTFTYSFTTEYKYSSETKREGSGCSATNVTYYWDEYYKIKSMSVNQSPASTDTSAFEGYMNGTYNESAKTMGYLTFANELKTYYGSFDSLPAFNTLLDNLMSSDQSLVTKITQLATKGQAAKNSYDKATAVYAKAVAFWVSGGSASCTKIDNFIKNSFSAYQASAFGPYVVQAMELMKSDFTNAATGIAYDDLAKMKSVYSELNTLYNGKLKGFSSEVESIFKDQYGYSNQAVVNYLDNLAKMIRYKNIRDTKAEVDKVIADLNGGLEYSAEDQARCNVRYNLTGVVKDSDLTKAKTSMTALRDVIEGVQDDPETTDVNERVVGQKEQDPDYVQQQYGTAYYQEFINSLTWEFNRRGMVENYQSYRSFFLAEYNSVSSAYSTYYQKRLDDAEKMLQTAKNDFNVQKKLLGEAVVLETFTPIRDKNYLTLIEEAQAHIDGLYTEALTLLEKELDSIITMMQISGNVVNFTNFSSFKSYMNSSADLYTWLAEEHAEKLTDSIKTKYEQVTALRASYDAFVSSMSISNLTKEDISDEYPVREASVDDYARTTGEDYEVTHEKLEATVSKVDSFLNSEDFARIADLDDADNLQEYVNNMLGEKLFNNEIANKIMALIYPMLTELLDEKLADIIEELNREGGYDLAGISDQIKAGKLKIYVDGAKGTKDFVALFRELGLYVYPTLLSEFYASKYASDPICSQIAADLKDGGRTWTNFENKDHDVEFDYDWGIDDCVGTEAKYEKFREVLGKIFEPVKPALMCILGVDDYSASATGAAAIEILNLKAKALFTFTEEYTAATADLTFSLDHVDGYGKVWVPLMEALGLNTDANAYTFPKMTSGMTTTQLVAALFAPIYEMVEELTNAPIDRLMSMLPNLSYMVAFDKFAELMNSLELTINFQAKNVKVTDSNSLLIKYLGTGILSLFESKLKGDTTINLGEKLDLNDILDCDVSDINSIVHLLLDKLGFGALELPIMNVGNIIRLSTASADYKTQRTSGTKRGYLTADKGDVFLKVCEWIMTSAGNRALIDSILETLNEDEQEEDQIVLDDLIYGILAAASTSPSMAVAALVELMNPQTYALNEMEWFSNATYDAMNQDVEGYNTASTVYLNYANNWNKEKAEYLAANIEDVFGGILATAGVDENIVETEFVKALTKSFTNKALTDMVKALAGLNEILSENISGVLKTETGIDLNVWNVAFGYLFDQDPATDTKGAGFDGLTYDPEKEQWTLNDKTLEDGDVDTFTDILCSLLSAFGPLANFLFNGKDIELFNKAVTFKGYSVYDESIVYLFEAIGVDPDDIKTEAEYQAAYQADPMQGIDYLIRTLFDRIGEVVKDPSGELLKVLPSLIYFVESNGISTVVLNLLHPVLVILDTVRPLIGDLADMEKQAVKLLGEELDQEETSITKEDLAKYINKDGGLSFKNLSLETILDVFDAILYKETSGVDGQGNPVAGIELQPVISPALRTFCSNIIEKTDSKASGTSLTVDTTKFTGADTLTVLFSCMVEFLMYGNNAERLDAYLTEKEILDENSAGILAAVSALFNAEITDMDTPNWEYTFVLASGNGYEYDPETFNYNILTEGEMIDLSEYHTINYLCYGEDSDWKEDTAEYLNESLDAILLELVKMDDPEAADLSAYLTDLNIYSEELIGKLSDILKQALGKIDKRVVKLLDSVLETKLMSVLDFDVTSYDIKDRAGFVKALSDLFSSVEPIIEYMFLGQDLNYFTSSGILGEAQPAGSDLISLPGAEGYKYGIIPLLEAFGCTPNAADYYYVDPEQGVLVENAGTLMITDVLNALCDLYDGMMKDPANKALAMLPNLIYFINSDGLTVSVRNSLRALVSLVDIMNSLQGNSGNKLIDVKELLGFDIMKQGALSFDFFFDLIEELTEDETEEGEKIPGTGLDLKNTIGATLKTFYIGSMEYYTSKNGMPAFRMNYNDKEDRKDMLTIILSMVVEAIRFDKDAAAALDRLLKTDGLFATAAEILGGLDPSYYTYEESDLNYYAGHEIDEESLAYLKYANDWAEEDAAFIDEHIDEIVDALLTIADKKSLTELMDINIYDAKLVQSVADVLHDSLEKLNSTVVSFAGEVIGCNLAEVLKVTAADYTYVTDRDTFVQAMTELLAPADKLIRFMLLGEDYQYFYTAAGDPKVVVIKGGAGYEKGIKPLLEAVGCDTSSISTDKTQFVSSLLNCICNYIDQFMADPANTALNILPGVFYYINKGGLTASVYNVIAPLTTIVNKLSKVISIDLDDLYDSVDNLNLEYFCSLLKKETDIVVPENIVNFLKTFFYGKLNENGVAEYSETQNRTGMITILASLALEVLEYGNNAAALNQKNVDVEKLVYLLKTKYDIELQEINWQFLKESAPVTSAYISYNNNWNEVNAKYVADNLDTLIATFISQAGEGAKTIEDLLKVDIYSADTLNLLIKLMQKVVEEINKIGGENENYQGKPGSIATVLGQMLGVDLNSFKLYKDTDITDRASFENALVSELSKFNKIWELLLLDQDMTFFTASFEGEATEGRDLIVLNGAKGYDFGIVPILEAFGGDPKPASAFDGNGKAMMTEIVRVVCDFIDTYIRSDIGTKQPFGKVLDRVPNLLYFINSDGLTACVNNLISAADYLVTNATAFTGEQKTLNDFVKEAGFDLDAIDFTQVFELLKNKTGIDLKSLLGYLTVFNTGSVESFLSANGDTAYRMVFGDDFQVEDLITFFLSYALEMLTNNAEAASILDELLGTNGMLTKASQLLGGLQPEYYSKEKPDYYKGHEISAESLAYLQYYNDWKKEDAAFIDQKLDEIIDAFLTIMDQKSLSEMMDIDIYNAKTVKLVADVLNKALKKLDPTILTFLSQITSCDLNQILKVSEADFSYVKDRRTFVQAFTDILKPAEKAIRFLMLGEDYEFFSSASGEKALVTLTGGEGYEKGLKPLLDACGFDTTRIYTTDKNQFIPSLLNCICDFVDQFLAKPADTALNILPGALYYINEGGVQATVYNMIAPLTTIVKNLEGVVELDLSELYDTIDAINIAYLCDLLTEEVGLVIPSDIVSFLQTFFYGELNEKGQVVYTTAQDRSGMITILLSLALEVLDYGENAKLLDQSGVNVTGLIEFLKKEYNIPLRSINWDCVKEMPVTTAYLTYGNGWNKENAQYVANNLDAIIASFIMESVDDGKSLEDLLGVDIYSADTLNLLVKLMQKVVEEINKIGGENKNYQGQAGSIATVLGQLLGVDLNSFVLYKDSDITDRVSFETALVSELSKFNKIWELLLLDQDMTFFTASGMSEEKAGEDLFVLNGAEGYDFGIVPILEAFGGDPKAASAFDGDGTAMVTEIVRVLCDFIDTYITSDIGTKKPFAKVLDRIPNLLYFINAGGLTACANNLISAADYLVMNVTGLTGKQQTINDFVKEAGFDLEAIDFIQAFKLLKDKTGLDLENLLCYLTVFNTGNIESFDSVNGQTAYRMVFGEKFGREDLITFFLSYVLELLKNDGETAALLDQLLGTDGLLTKASQILGGMQPVYYMNLNPKYYEGHEISAESLSYLKYLNDWKASDAEFVDEKLGEIIDALLTFMDEKSLSEMMDIDIYNAKTVKLVADALNDALKQLDPTIVTFLGSVIGCDLNQILEITASDFSYVNDRKTFIQAFTAILQPADKVIRFLLLEEDYEFFSSASGQDSLIILRGGEGYNKGLKPLLTAFGFDCSKIDTTNKENFIPTLLECLCSFVDQFMEKPVDTALNILPGILYYINEGGIQATVYNMIAPLTTIVNNLSEVVVDLDLSELYQAVDQIDMGYLCNLLTKELDIEVPEKIVSFLKTFFYGEVKNGTVVYTETQDRGGMITILISLLLEVLDYSDNAKVLNQENLDIDALLTFFKTGDVTIPVREIDWDYLTEEEVPVTTDYLIYNNNWNTETAEYISENLDEILADFIDEYLEGAQCLNDLLDNSIYSAKTLNLLVEPILDLVDQINKIGGENVKYTNGKAGSIATVLGQLLELDLNSFKLYEDSQITSRAAFEAALNKELKKFDKIWKLILLDQDMKFFTGSGMGEVAKDSDILFLNGTNGYDNAIVPILEAFGGSPKASSEFDGDVDAMIEEIVDEICDFIDTYLYSDIDVEKPFSKIIDKIPNLIYFINAGGLTASVNNLLGAVDYVVTNVTAFTGKKQTVNDLIEGFDLEDIGFGQLLDLISTETGISFDCIEDYILNFNTGILQPYTSANGKTAYRMTCGKTFESYDVITTLLCLMGVLLDDDANASVMKDLLGEKAYATVKGLLNTKEFAMKEMEWLFIENYEEAPEKVYSAFETTEEFQAGYGTLFTEEEATDLANNFEEFADIMIRFLGPEVGGKTVTSLDELVETSVGTTLYTSDTIGSIMEAILDFNETLNALPSAKHIKAIIYKSLGVDLTVYDGFAEKNAALLSFADGDRDAFVEALIALLKPLYPVLEWLLCDQDIAFLTDANKNDAIMLYGAEGYKYGVIPLMEALIFDQTKIKTAEAYYADIKKDEDALILDIILPLFDKLDEILKDPATQAMELLPNICYFINSKGLDTCWKNLLHPVYGLLETLKPMIGEVDLYAMMGIRLDSLTFDDVITLLIDALNEESTADFRAFALNSVDELTIGTLKKITSQNGLTAYRMIQTDDATKAETVTTILRMAIRFVADDSNAEALKQTLADMEKEEEQNEANAQEYTAKGVISDDDQDDDEDVSARMKFYNAIIDFVSEFAQTDEGMDAILYGMYLIFTNARDGVISLEATENDFNAKYKIAYQTLIGSTNPILGYLAEALFDAFDDEIGSIVTPDEIAPDGIIPFVKQTKKLFERMYNATSTVTSSIASKLTALGESIRSTFSNLFVKFS